MYIHFNPFPEAQKLTTYQVSINELGGRTDLGSRDATADTLQILVVKINTKQVFSLFLILLYVA